MAEAEKRENSIDNEPRPFRLEKDLHAHITGSISPASICDIIYQNGLHASHRDQINSITQPFGISLSEAITDNLDLAKRKFADVYTCSPNGRNRFEEVMQRFSLTSFLLQFPGIKSQVGEAVSQTFKSNGVNYVEWRVDPFSATQYETAEEAFEKLSEYYSGMKKVDLDSRFVFSVSRSRYRNEKGIDREKIDFLTIELEKLLDMGRNLPIIGFDVSGAEVVPLYAFKSMFDLAHDYNLGVVPHIAEGASPTLEEGMEDLDEALNLSANRFGHAVVVYMSLDNFLGRRDQYGEIYDESRIRNLRSKQIEVLSRIKESGVAIEVCPTSNLTAHLGLLSYAEHPINRLAEAGIPFVICTDDFGIFGRTLQEEVSGLTMAKDLRVEQIIKDTNSYALNALNVK